MPDEVLAEMSPESHAQRWHRTLIDHPDGTLVAVGPDDEVLGFSRTGPSRDDDAAPMTGEVIALYVLPEHWGTGIGFRLWEAATALLRRQGFQHVTLWTLEDNHRGRPFYESVGLELDSVPPRPFRIGGAELPSLRYRTAPP